MPLESIPYGSLEYPRQNAGRLWFMGSVFPSAVVPANAGTHIFQRIMDPPGNRGKRPGGCGLCARFSPPPSFPRMRESIFSSGLWTPAPGPSAGAGSAGVTICGTRAPGVSPRLLSRTVMAVPDLAIHAVPAATPKNGPTCLRRPSPRTTVLATYRFHTIHFESESKSAPMWQCETCPEFPDVAMRDLTPSSTLPWAGRL